MKGVSEMSEREIIDYAQERGLAAAADLLLLVGPDGFSGGYDLFCDLESAMREVLAE